MNKKKSKTKAILLTTVVMVVFLPVTILGIIILSVVCSSDYVKFDKTKIAAYGYNLIITDANGQIIDEDTNIDNRTNINVNSLASHTVDAFVSTEDKRFFKHNGIDVVRIAKAFLNNIKSGAIKEGASTISQQLVKNVFLTSDKKIKRKINEILLALKLEEEFTKEEILSAYLNTVYFGGGAYGIQNASRQYFDTDADKLTIAQSAGLAGMLKAPNTYSPTKSYDKFTDRKELVLSQMLKFKKINLQEYQQAGKEVLKIKKASSTSRNQNYISAVLSEASRLTKIPLNTLLNQKTEISTYYDPQAQAALKKAIQKDNTKCSDGSYPDKCGIVLNNKNRGIQAFYGQSLSNLTNKQISAGSTLKPLAVYAPALQNGIISPLTPVLDQKTDFGQNFSPSNYKQKYLGWTTIRKAVEQSLNIPSVKTANALGVDKCVDYLNKNGFDVDASSANLTIALGNLNGGCKLLQLLNGYATLSQEGKYYDCSFIRSIKVNGKTVYTQKKPKTIQVFDKSTSFLMTDMLCDVTKSGTARALKHLNLPIAGKTGTVGQKTGSNTDALFCGYTSQNTFLFWLGADNSSGGFDQSVTGGNQPTAIACDFLTNYYTTDYKLTPFLPPDSVKKVKVDKVVLNKKQQILLANDDFNDDEVITDYFCLANVPTEVSLRSKSILSPLMLTLSINDDKIYLTADNAEAKIYKLFGDRKKLLGTHSVIDDSPTINAINSYIAQVTTKNNVQVSKKAQIYFKKEDLSKTPPQKNPNDNIFKFWYWNTG